MSNQNRKTMKHLKKEKIIEMNKIDFINRLNSIYYLGKNNLSVLGFCIYPSDAEA